MGKSSPATLRQGKKERRRVLFLQSRCGWWEDDGDIIHPALVREEWETGVGGGKSTNASRGPASKPKTPEKTARFWTSHLSSLQFSKGCSTFWHNPGKSLSSCKLDQPGLPGKDAREMLMQQTQDRRREKGTG